MYEAVPEPEPKPEPEPENDYEDVVEIDRHEQDEEAERTTRACAWSEVPEQRQYLTEVVTGSVRETRFSIQAGFGIIWSVYIYIYLI